MALDIIQGNLYPIPPQETEISNFEDVKEFEDKTRRHLAFAARYQQILRNRLSELDKELEVESLIADKIAAGTIGVDSIFIGGPEFEIDGLLTQIRIYDDQPTPQLRIELGKFGSGADYGQKFYDQNGTLFINISSDTFIQTGASNPKVRMDVNGIEGFDSGGNKVFDLNTDGTVRFGDVASKNIYWTGSDLLLNGELISNANIPDGEIQDAKIGSVDAGTITVGTLTADGSPVGIEITGSGAFLASSGGDIILRRNATDQNLIVFQDTDLSTIGTITASTNLYRLEHSDGAKLTFLSGGGVQLEAATATSIIQIFGEVEIVDDLQIPTNQASSPASGSIRWDNVNKVLEVWDGSSWLQSATFT